MSAYLFSLLSKQHWVVTRHDRHAATRRSPAQRSRQVANLLQRDLTL